MNQSVSHWEKCVRKEMYKQAEECEENELRRKWGISNSVLMCILTRSSGKASEAHKLELLWSLRLFFLPQNGFEILYIYIPIYNLKYIIIKYL